MKLKIFFWIALFWGVGFESLAFLEKIPLFRKTYGEFTKNEKELEDYFYCQKRSHEDHRFYLNDLFFSIETTLNNYEASLSDENRIPRKNLRSLFSCLIFRESAWKAQKSRTGAVGLGQFTTIALYDLMERLQSPHQKESLVFQETCLNFKDDRSIKEFCEEMKRRSLRTRVMQKFFRQALRYQAVQDFWKQFGERNYRCPKGGWNCSPSPAAMKDLRAYVSLKENHQVVMILSMLHMLGSQIWFQNSGFDWSNLEASFFATAAYNMGRRGFYLYALNRGRGEQNLKQWISNLKNSTADQRFETSRHLISIQRCAEKGFNFPMCGTWENEKKTPCERQLSKRDRCLNENRFLCGPERKGQGSYEKRVCQGKQSFLEFSIGQKLF